MYILHFYAATHTDWNRPKLITVISKSLPVFVSEFSICDASGNGWNDINSGNEWMDPPRTGNTEKFMSSVVRLSPKKVVYVSCGPDTLARDLKYFNANGYNLYDRQKCFVIKNK